MKKILRSIIAFILTLTIIFSCILPVAALLNESNYVAYVWADGDYDNGTYHSSIKEAWDDACQKGNVLLLSDWKTEKSLATKRYKTINLYMNDYSIDRGLNAPQKNGEVFLVIEKSTLKIYGGKQADTNAQFTSAKITGGYSSNTAGGIQIQENSALYLYGVSVTGNKTTDANGGGGIRLQNDKGRLEMNEHTYIANNEAINSSGGGISVQGINCLMLGGNVLHNKSEKNGGGIFINKKMFDVSNVTISNNEASENGGGIYLSKNAEASITNCSIDSNTSSKNGGGICVDGNKNTLSSTIVTKNFASLGGGVFVNPECSLALSGDLIIKDNKTNNTSTNEANNLYLHSNNDQMALITGYPTSGEVHIGWDSSKNALDSLQISKTEGVYSTKFIVSDVENQFIYWSWNTQDGKNDRHLRTSTTNFNCEIEFDTIDVPISERYHIIENGYLGKYDLQEGIYNCQGGKMTNKSAVYFYSDGYFADAPHIYNPSLATMSLSLASSAANAAKTDMDFNIPSGDYSNLFRHAKQLLSDIGIKDEDIYVNNGFDSKPTLDTIGMIMGSKEISINGESYILIPIAIRGNDYGSEWGSNFTLTDSGEAYGFATPATTVIKQIQNYISTNTSFDISSALNEGRVKFWLVGFSRGSAVANITSKRLTDIYGEAGNSIYAYCFEVPKGGTDAAELNEEWTYNGIYANIHNIINRNDPITYVAPKQMGFKRYGVDHYVPGTDAGEIKTSTYITPTGITVTTHADNESYALGNADYDKIRLEAMQHLATIDDSIIFYDYFSLATMDYFSAILNSPMFLQIEGGNEITIAEWLEFFIDDLQYWAATRVENGEYNQDFRDYYTSHTEFAGQEFVTLESAIQYFFDLVFGMENPNELLDVMMYRLEYLLLDYGTLLNLYLNVIQKWDELSPSEQLKHLDSLWNCVDGDLQYPGGIPVKKITDFAQTGDGEKMKASAYTLLAFLFSFIAKDYDTAVALEATQIHLGTLLYNINAIAQCHFPEVCMAWLRSYDELYSEDNPNSKFANKAINLINDENNVAPSIEAQIEINDNDTVIYLSSIVKSADGVDKSSTNNGAAIYYAIFENGSIIEDWKLYREPITIDISNDNNYTLKAYAIRFNEISEWIEIENDQLRPKDMAHEIEHDKPKNDLLGIQDPISDNTLVFTIIILSITLLAFSLLYFYIPKKKSK